MKIIFYSKLFLLISLLCNTQRLFPTKEKKLSSPIHSKATEEKKKNWLRAFEDGQSSRYISLHQSDNYVPPHLRGNNTNRDFESDSTRFYNSVHFFPRECDHQLCKQLNILCKEHFRYPLHESIYHNKTDQFLSNSQRFDPKKNNEPDGFYQTPLQLAILHTNSTVINCLIKECKVDPNSFEARTSSPLSLAISFCNFSDVQCLVEEGQANTNHIDYEGNTPLHIATQNNRLEIVQYLIEQCKANPHTANHKNLTALEIAFNKEYLNIAQYLLKSIDYDINKIKKNNQNLLHQIIKNFTQ